MADSPMDGVASESSSRAGDNLYEQDELGGLLKSLINANGLQTAWKGVMRRLVVTEQRLRDHDAKFQILPSAYVQVVDYKREVKMQHAEALAAHEEKILALQKWKAEQTRVTTTEQVRLQNTCRRVDELEEWQGKVRPIVEDVQARAEELQKDVAEMLREAKQQLEEQTANSQKTLDTLKSQVEDRLAGVENNLRDLDAGLREFARTEIKTSTDNLMRFNPEPGAKLSDHQQKLIDYITASLVEPLQRDQHRNDLRIEAVSDDVTKKHDDAVRMIRQGDKLSMEIQRKIKDLSSEVKADLDTRATKVEMIRLNTDLEDNIGKLESDSQGLRTKVVMKLNEFMDHFGKIQDSIDDHEHCLRHHAEEIENRGTKYDLLMCQNQIDRCTRKADFARETQDLRKVMNWQSTKIESLGLVASGLSRKTVVNGPGGPRRARRESRMLTSSLTSSSLRPPTTPGEDALLRPDSMCSQRSSASKRPSLKAVVDVASVVVPALSVVKDEPGEEAEARTHDGGSGSDPSNKAAEEELFEENESEEEDRRAEPLLRQQLEAVAMALVALGHLMLREPKLGMSRETRLKHEGELLTEMTNLRHWVSNRIAPSGWDPSKIATMALHCSHPREDELKRPLPQTSLRAVMNQESGSSLRSPYHSQTSQYASQTSLDAPQSARGFQRSAGALIAGQLQKAPLSARGCGNSGVVAGLALPPLLGITAGIA